MTQPEPLFARLALPDDAPALRFGDVTLTYQQLARAACAHAYDVLRHGAHPGDRVAVVARPHLATMVALVGNALAGAVSVPINPASGTRELDHLFGDAKPVRTYADSADALPGRDVHAITVDPVASGVHAPEHPPVDDGALLVLYTSGTTGSPKGAVLTRRNLASNVDVLAHAWQWTSRDRLVHALPLFHVHGLALGLFGTLRAGSSLRWLAKFSPEGISSAFDDGATMLFAVPTMYHRLADACERDPALARSLSRARLLGSGSAPLPLREHTRMRALTGHSVIERYGLTETMINTAVRFGEGDQAGRVGRALEGVEVRLVDDARVPIATHDDATLGEVAVRGPNVFAGYLDRPDATSAVRDAEGWFYTGDLATMDARGSLRIVGRRATDLIKTGGYKVGAGEVEAALLEHASVAEAAVIGEADDDLGERIVAFVVAREGCVCEPARLIEHVAGLLAPHKRPRAVRIVDELPRNALGKVLKGRLRASVTP